MNNDTAFQDQIPGNHCFGCGPDNANGLQLKSYWLNESESVCRFMPSSHQCAAPTTFLNGGIIATIIDCHCVCTAIAKSYIDAGLAIGSGEKIWFATGKLEVSYSRPVAIDREVELVANIVEAKEKKVTLTCTLSSGGEICAESEVVAVRVPGGWGE